MIGNLVGWAVRVAVTGSVGRAVVTKWVEDKFNRHKPGTRTMSVNGEWDETVTVHMDGSYTIQWGNGGRTHCDSSGTDKRGRNFSLS